MPKLKYNDNGTWKSIAPSQKEFDDLKIHFDDTARQTSTLMQGTSVVSGETDTLASVEVEGRTLTSQGNSYLQTNKKYVLADKNTKVIIDGSMGTPISGVAKFTKSYKSTTANFVGKVSGSNTVNAHVAKERTASNLDNPSLFTDEHIQVEYDMEKDLNGNVNSYTTTTNSHMAQILYSFNIIEQVERTLGRIPKSTVADKVQWLKDNVEKLTANWHGFGSSVGGNKASLSNFRFSDNTWVATQTSTSSTVSKLTISLTNAQLNTDRIDANGMVHFLANADASDGVTASTINTDFIDLQIDLKDSAQLDTRPTIIRVETFEGKVSGDTVSNPHKVHVSTAVGMKNPTEITGNYATGFQEVSEYSTLSTLNGTNRVTSTSAINGQIAQQLFSFNLIEAVERNIGKIPRSTVADKVQWLKDNVAKLTANWYGFGSSVGGNKANFDVWYNSTWTSNTQTHANPTVTKLSRVATLMSIIDSNGFVHYLAYAEPSDGVTASVINTDYIDLEIQLKSNADFNAPRVPLYEVTDDEYNKILVDWDATAVQTRYPSVVGTQHLQGVAISSEGDNLLPPFSEWTLHANAIVKAPYELELNATGATQLSSVDVSARPNQAYTLSFDNSVNGAVYGQYLDSNKVKISDWGGNGNKESNNSTITTPSNTAFIKILVGNEATSGVYTIKQPMLTLGNVAKPFVPKNSSYLFANVKLGAISNQKDILYEESGRFKVRKSLTLDVLLDGSLAWAFDIDRAGFKTFGAPKFSDQLMNKDTTTLIKHNGLSLKKVGVDWFNGDEFNPNNSASKTYISVSDTDSGWFESWTGTELTADFIKAYFNGWKYTGTADKVTQTWVSVVDGTASPTQTLAYVSTTLAPNYTPYKLSYVLAAPQIVDVTDKVEGSVKINNLTQVSVDSGYVIKEKVTPYLYTDNKYYINNIFVSPTNKLSQKTNKIIGVYKNGNLDKGFTVLSNYNSTTTYGGAQAYIDKALFDATAEYTVVYAPNDKPSISTNPLSVKLTYANNIRTALSDTVTKVEDGLTMLSVHEKIILDMLARLKALEQV